MTVETSTPDALPDVVVVANPYSGWRANRDRVAELVDALRRHGLTANTVWDLGSPTSPQVVESLRSCRCVVAAGGDGTVAAAVNVLKSHGLAPGDGPDETSAAGSPALAILPLGAANLLAKELGFAVESDRLASAIAAGRSRRIDLGRADGRWFTLMLSAGIDAEVVRRLAEWRSTPGRLRRARYASYVRPTLAGLMRYDFGLVELETDDGRCCRGAGALVFNVDRHGIGLPFAPDARADDGLLHWVVFEKPGRLAAIGYLASVARRAHRSRRDVQYGSAREVRLRSDTPVPVQIDGEAAGATPVCVEIDANALDVVDMAAD